jgi:hypothetical protein
MADRIVADEPELATAGLYRNWMAWAPELGVVEVHVAGGPDERAAAEFFAARYGDAVAVRWLGPSRFRELPHPFGSWTSDGRRIRVFFALDPNGYQPGQARVTQETDELLVIALSALEPVGLITQMGGSRTHRVERELREPVGGRAVIDASVGVARPSLAELRSHPDRRRPNPAGSDHFATGSLVQPTGISIDDLETQRSGMQRPESLGRGVIDDLEDLTLFSAEELAALPKMDQTVLDEIIDALPRGAIPDLSREWDSRFPRTRGQAAAFHGGCRTNLGRCRKLPASTGPAT